MRSADGAREGTEGRADDKVEDEPALLGSVAEAGICGAQNASAADDHRDRPRKVIQGRARRMATAGPAVGAGIPR